MVIGGETTSQKQKMCNKKPNPMMTEIWNFCVQSKMGLTQTSQQPKKFRKIETKTLNFKVFPFLSSFDWKNRNHKN